ncbi:Hypothetical predicted protein [Mytilus galloprovincialis]|uniref:RNase H type-1 domain-containing protein n=1 Tax=Mytilus galloprovincialis TaxID=29158 RepID=A0A8B6FPC0_MYTGA|nr:Hypothetical predicted protein [Mytilus galloprovincialis]
MNTQKLLQLYFCLIRSVVEYSCPAWQVAEQKDLQKLDRLQRKAPTLCLDMPSTSGREALEIEAEVLLKTSHTTTQTCRSKWIHLASRACSNCNGTGIFQSAVGLLTLNWAPKSYIDVIRDIREHIVRTKGMEICILWTPRHANIQGNDEADLLAEQAAEEATQLLPKNNIITLQDVKQGAHKSEVAKTMGIKQHRKRPF